MAEGCGFRDHFGELEELGVQVYGVSFDAPAENALFKFNNKFPYRLLSDKKRELALAYGAASSAGQTFADRVTVVIGPSGKWLLNYPQVDNVGTHSQDIAKDLRTIFGL